MDTIRPIDTEEGPLMRETRIGKRLYPVRAIAVAVVLGASAAVAVVLLIF